MTVGITNGNVYGDYLIKATLTPAEVATIVTVEQTFTVPGLKVGDHVDVNAPGIQAGTAITGARVSAADTLALTFTNPTAGAVTPLAGVHTIRIARPEAGLAKDYITD